MPFLGPAVIAWITLIVGVMASYFLFVARAPRSAESGRRPEDSAPRRVESPPAPPWIEAAPSARLRSDLPSYDMEDFPTEMWSSAPPRP
jgi:hypothetical protein